MWNYACDLGVDGIVEMSDDDYMDGLAFVHQYFAKNPRERTKLQLQPEQGPQSIEARGTAKEDYVGSLQYFPCYSRPVFIKNCRHCGMIAQWTMLANVNS